MLDYFCSAEVGRTGTFIAVKLLQHLKTSTYVDIFGLVHAKKLQRKYMVQTEVLCDCVYIFIYQRGSPQERPWPQ